MTAKKILWPALGEFTITVYGEQFSSNLSCSGLCFCRLAPLQADTSRLLYSLFCSVDIWIQVAVIDYGTRKVHSHPGAFRLPFMF